MYYYAEFFTQRLRSAFVREFLGPFVKYFGTPILLVLLCTVIWCTIKSCRNAKRRLRSDKKQN
jgi:hypothetical protein